MDIHFHHDVVRLLDEESNPSNTTIVKVSAVCKTCNANLHLMVMGENGETMTYPFGYIVLATENEPPEFTIQQAHALIRVRWPDDVDIGASKVTIQ